MTGPLSGVRVLDLGQYVAGPLVGTLLGDQGATVDRIEPPDGPRWRHPANALLHRGRETRRLDLRRAGDRAQALALAGVADVLVEGFRPGVADRLGLGWDACRALNPRLVYCSLPGFGREDERAGLPGWEALVTAAGGAYAPAPRNPLLGSGWWPGEDPVWSPLPLASVFAAGQAALAIVAALIARDRDGVGQRIEVPLFGAVLEAEGARLVSYERRPRGGRFLGAGLYRCADHGYVSFIATRMEHLEWLLEAVGSAAAFADVADFDLLGGEPDVRRDLARRLVALFAGRTSDEWEAIGRETELPLGKVRPASEWVREPQAEAAGVVLRRGPLRTLGPAVTVTPGEEAASLAVRAAAGEAPLAGVRVLDLTRAMAGPTAARLLAELGADVVKADADPATRRVGFREPLYHEHMNRGKRSTVLEPGTENPRDLLGGLVRWADVVVATISLPALERLGVTPEAARRLRPDGVFVYLNAFGTSGPWARRRGFAETANVETGVTWRMLGDAASGTAPQVDFPRAPFTDYLAGIFTAFAATLALRDRSRTGRGQLAETSLLHAACYAQLPYLVGDAERDPPDDRLVGVRGWRPLHRLYRAADGWLAVGGREERRDAVVAAFGLPGETPFEEALGRALAERPREECARVLQEAGVAAQHVLDVEQVMAPGGAADRAGLRDEQESEEFGLVVQPAATIRLEGTPIRTGAVARPFGAEEEEIRAELDA
jgi:crotonobetainyl-CoA:carnitine CoA-transferase CaiB-like acyl-CoA transferase